jgi:hypothetical protein
VNFACLALIMRRKAGRLLPFSSLGRMAGLSVLVFGAAWATAGTAWLWLALIPVWAGLYVLAGRLLGMEEARLFLHMLWGRVRRGRGSGNGAAS